jgi:hypothetical protein
MANSPKGAATGSVGPRMDCVLRHWIQDQGGYFRRCAPRNEATHGRFASVARICLAVAVGATLIDLGAHIGVKHHLINPIANFHDLWCILIFVALAAAGLLHQYAENSAYKVQARKYEWMSSLFGKANQKLGELLRRGDFGSAKRLIRELGEEALTENADWVIQHRARPPQLPHA